MLRYITVGRMEQSVWRRWTCCNKIDNGKEEEPKLLMMGVVSVKILVYFIIKFFSAFEDHFGNRVIN